MDLNDLKPTARTLEGPAARVQELHRGEHVWSALTHRARYRDPELVEEVLELGGSFLRNPMIAGLVEIDDWSPQLHQLLYPTGRVWSLAELLAAHSRPLGLRAGLEFAYRAALILQEASAAGEESGVPLHGDPTPWRWFLDAEGDLQLIGWGLPALELYAVDRDPELLLPTASYQYLAPERLAGNDEDLSTDLFVIALIAAEMMLGAPVYSGTTHAVRTQAQRAEGARLLHQASHVLTSDLLSFLSRAVAPYRDGRHQDVEDFIRDAHDLLYSPITEGPPLTELLRPVVQATEPLPSPPPQPESTAERWRPVRRRSSGSGVRPIDDVAAPSSEQTYRMPKRDPGRPSSAADALRDRLRASQASRDDRLRNRLGRASVNKPLRDRTTLFPTLHVKSDMLRYLIEMPEGGSVWARLGPEETLACSAARVADQSRHTPMGPRGEIEGWFRLTQGGEAWYGCTLTKVLDAREPAQLEFIPNRVVQASVSLHPDEPPVEVEVGTAVHASFLISYFRHRFELRARDWALYAEDDRPLDPWQVLDDFQPQDGLALRMRRTRRRGQRRRSR